MFFFLLNLWAKPKLKTLSAIPEQNLGIQIQPLYADLPEKVQEIAFILNNCSERLNGTHRRGKKAQFPMLLHEKTDRCFDSVQCYEHC